MAIRYENQLYRVIAADYHPGQGKMGGVNHLRLKNLNTGTIWEHTFRAELKVEEVPVERQTLAFLYSDGNSGVFMIVYLSYDVIPSDAINRKHEQGITADVARGPLIADARRT
jgi:translation elongation factor P/translation initiation factor 5A